MTGKTYQHCLIERINLVFNAFAFQKKPQIETFQLTVKANTFITLTISGPYTKSDPCCAKLKNTAAFLPMHSKIFRPISIRMQNNPSRN